MSAAGPAFRVGRRFPSSSPQHHADAAAQWQQRLRFTKS